MKHVLMLFERKHKKTKNYFSKRNCRKCRPTQNRMKQNNDHTKIVLKMRFCYHLIIVYLSFRDTLFTKKQDNQASSTKSIWQKENEKNKKYGYWQIFAKS